jgi:hypothetical protein
MSEDPPNGDASPPSIEPLLDKAFGKGPAMEANRLIHEVREALRRDYGRAHNFEVSLLDRAPEHLWQTALPQLRRYLRAMGYTQERAESVFVSLFFGETIYFINASDFVQETQRIALSWWAAQSDDGSLPDDVPMLPLPVRKRRERDGDDEDAEASDVDGTGE